MAEELRSRQRALVEANLGWLRQAECLLMRLDDAEYRTAPAGVTVAPAGAHLRHVLDFYECFLDGLPLAHVDYERRGRQASVEQCREAALEKVREIAVRLEMEGRLLADGMVFVKAEEADASLGAGERFVLSSTGRELQVLSSHTVHHFALIAIALRGHGHVLDADFGVAPSTLRFRAWVALGAA
jgi:uncharacterized damage-inducible protein DinB